MSKSRMVFTFIVLSLCAGMAYFTPLLKFTFYDQMMRALSLDDVQLNVLSSVYALVNTLVYPISGILGDKFSTRKMISLSMFGMALLTVWYYFTTDYTTLIVIHAFYGIFAVGTFWAPYIKAIRSLGEESIQSKLFGMSEAARGLGQAAVGFVAVWLISMAATVGSGFSNMLLMMAGVYTVLGVLVLIFLPADQDGQVGSAEISVKGNMLATIKNPGTWIITLMIMSGYAVYLLANTYLTTYSVRVLGISENVASTLGVARTYLIILVAGLGGGWLMDKFTYKGKSFFFIFSLCAIIMAGIMFTSSYVALCLTLTVVLTLVTNIVKATYWSTFGQAGIPLGLTATATGIVSFIAFIPESFITIICGGWLKKAEAGGNIAAGFTQIFILMIVLSMVSAMISLLLLRRTKAIENAGGV